MKILSDFIKLIFGIEGEVSNKEVIFALLGLAFVVAMLILFSY